MSNILPFLRPGHTPSAPAPAPSGRLPILSALLMAPPPEPAPVKPLDPDPPTQDLDTLRRTGNWRHLKEGKRIEFGLHVLSLVELWLGKSQAATVRNLIRTSEEKDFFIGKMLELEHTVTTMPATRGQENAEDPIVYLHYFTGGYDAWITEKDIGDPEDAPEEFQWQMFGYARFDHMPGDASLGYICLPELRDNQIELDFHWSPTPLSQVKAKLNPDREAPANDPSPAAPEDEPRPSPITGIFNGWTELRPQLPADMIVFVRAGDFYETFSDDAKLAAPLLNITLTKRNMVPMCGVPVHAADTYFAKLLEAGHRVAVGDKEPEASTYHTQRILAPAKAEVPAPIADAAALDNPLAEGQAKFLAMADSFQPGAILASSWGYDQTNVSYYRITKRTKAFVELEQLEAKVQELHFMSGKSVPVDKVKAYRGEPVTLRRKIIDRGDNKLLVKIEDYARAYLWDGTPQSCSWYA